MTKLHPIAMLLACACIIITEVAYNAQESARGEFDGVHKLQFDAKQDINEYKTNDPTGFKELDQLTDNNGNNIDVYVGRKDLGKDMPGKTYWKYDEEWKKITTVQNGYVAVNAFSVYLNTNTINAGDVLAHEKGHILDIVKSPASYWADRYTWSEIDCQAPENRVNKYVTPARDEQFEYRNRSSDTFIRPKYTAPIH